MHLSILCVGPALVDAASCLTKNLHLPEQLACCLLSTKLCIGALQISAQASGQQAASAELADIAARVMMLPLA